MKDLLLAVLHVAVMTAKLCGPGGVRAVIAENLLLKQQLIVLRRARRRAPNLTWRDRLLCGFGSLFLTPARIQKVAIAFRPSTLLAFHQVLVRRKYHRLFSSQPCLRKPGPKGPNEERLIGTVRRLLDDVLFWNTRDLERKLCEFQAYYNAARGHASLEGHTPLTFATGQPIARAELSHVRWVSHCRNLVQLPVAARRTIRDLHVRCSVKG